MIVERVSGEAPPKYLIAPQWCLEKSVLRKQIEDRMVELNAWQGDRFDAAWHDTLPPPQTTPPEIEQQILQKGRLPVLKLS